MERKTITIETSYDGHYVIPDGVTEIGYYAFFGCNLSSVEIPNSVTSIGHSAFYHCRNLTSLEIPNSVTSIDACAFDGCSSLSSIVFPASLASIGDMAFKGCSKLRSITVDEDNPCFCDWDGVLYNKDMSCLLHYPAGKEEVSYLVPYGMTHFDLGIFDDAVYLKAVYLPETIESLMILSDKFGEGSLRELHIMVDDPETMDVEVTPHFFDAVKNITLYVPIGSSEAYREHWSPAEFKDIIEE